MYRVSLPGVGVFVAGCPLAGALETELGFCGSLGGACDPGGDC